MLASSLKGKELVPIFFSHGNTASPILYSQTLRLIASYGFIVFGICHQDESCLHTVTREGRDIYHGPRNYDIEEKKEKKAQELKIREKEFMTLIEELCF